MRMALEFAKALRHILFAVIVLHFSICCSSSNSNQESDCRYNVNSDQHSTSSLPCFARYAVKSFFREYDSFTDSNLQEYMVHKIPFGSDTTFSRLLDLKRNLVGEGSHRRLSSSIRFSIQPDLIADFSSQMCEVIFIERLPSGVFADPFELEHLLHRGVFKDASVFGDTNLELPSFLSNRSIVEVHLDADLDKSAGQQIVRDFKIEIPLHARYPPLEESGYSEVRFGVPDLFMRCKMQGGLPAQRCLLTPIASSGSLKLNDVVWRIPAGIKAHAKTVSTLTFASALLSAILIIATSFRHSRIESDESLKKS